MKSVGPPYGNAARSELSHLRQCRTFRCLKETLWRLYERASSTVVYNRFEFEIDLQSISKRVISRAIRPDQALSGPIWGYQARSGAIRPDLALSGPIWGYQARSGPIWGYQARSGPNRPDQARSGAIERYLPYFGPIWPDKYTSSYKPLK